MERVLIVAKTHMRSGACVSGLTRDTNRSIRLLTPDGSNQPANAPFEVGQVWEIEFQPRPEIIPPHVEDVLVTQQRCIGQSSKLRNILIQRVRPWQDGPEHLFDGKLTIENTSYISRAGGLPNQSTGYWLPSNPLSLNLHYREGQPYYQIDYTIRSNNTSYRKRLFIKYVGFGEPINLIPIGTLVRVSLARWWQRPGTEEERCYLQLSGWYL